MARRGEAKFLFASLPYHFPWPNTAVVVESQSVIIYILTHCVYIDRERDPKSVIMSSLHRGGCVVCIYLYLYTYIYIYRYVYVYTHGVINILCMFCVQIRTVFTGGIQND